MKSNVPVVADPPGLESLRDDHVLYETLKAIVQLLRDISKYLKDNEITDITP